MEILKVLGFTILFVSFRNAFCIQTYYMESRCGDTIDIISSERARIKLTALSKYRNNIYDCRLIVSSSDNIMISFEDMDIEYSTNCVTDWLTIYDGQYSSFFSSRPSQIGPRLCGQSSPSTPYESTGDYITLQFHSDRTLAFKGFDIIVTPFHTDLSLIAGDSNVPRPKKGVDI